METEKFEKFKFDLLAFRGFLVNFKVTYNETGSAFARFSMQLNPNQDEEAVWINCNAFGDVADTLSEKHETQSKMPVLIEGYFSTSKYQGKEYLNFNVIRAN